MAHCITVKLASGGTLKLEGDYNPFGLSEADHDFIESLLFSMRGYEAETAQPQASYQSATAQPEVSRKSAGSVKVL